MGLVIELRYGEKCLPRLASGETRFGATGDVRRDNCRFGQPQGATAGRGGALDEDGAT